jgi:hypothetical protein
MDTEQARSLLDAGVPSDAVLAVMVKSEDPYVAIPALMGGKAPTTCKGYDFNKGVDYKVQI